MFAPHTVKQEYGVTLDDIDLESTMTTWLQTQISLRRKRRKRNVEYDCANTITIRLPILNV